MTQHTSEKDKAKRRLETQQSRLKEINDGIAVKEAQVAEIRENARKAEQAASMNCERIKTRRKRKEVESEIRKLKKFIEERQPRIDEQDLIRDQYSAAMEKYKEAMTLIKQEKAALKVHVCTDCKCVCGTSLTRSLHSSFLESINICIIMPHTSLDTEMRPAAD